MSLKSPDRKVFFSKGDPADPRLGEMAHTPEDQADVMILGYPDDEGVRLNGGRPGASDGPDAIREQLYKCTPDPRRKTLKICDAGNLVHGGTIEERHDQARAEVFKWLARDQKVLSLGGGNDYAFADGLAFLQRYAKQKPLIINVDAHFDVRDTSKGINSGTPFYRLLESGIDFTFVEYGIQSQCNARAHWDYVLGKGGKIVALEDLLLSGRSLNEASVDALGEEILRQRPTFLALDMDAFSWPYAAATSAAWPIGLEPAAFFPFYHTLLKRLAIQVLGIYEVAPPLAAGPGTTKLAAQLAHGFLHV